MPNHDRGSGHARSRKRGRFWLKSSEGCFAEILSGHRSKVAIASSLQGGDEERIEPSNFTSSNWPIFGVDNSSELRFAFLASQAVALESTSVDYRNDCVPILDRIAAIGALHELRLIKRKFTATLFLQD